MSKAGGFADNVAEFIELVKASLPEFDNALAEVAKDIIVMGAEIATNGYGLGADEKAESFNQVADKIDCMNGAQGIGLMYKEEGTICTSRDSWYILDRATGDVATAPGSYWLRGQLPYGLDPMVGLGGDHPPTGNYYLSFDGTACSTGDWPYHDYPW